MLFEMIDDYLCVATFWLSMVFHIKNVYCFRNCEMWGFENDYQLCE